MNNLILLTSLILVFVAGLTVGLQFRHIVDTLKSAIELLQATQTVERRKNTGVVRPGLNEVPTTTPDTGRNTGVVRPRTPVEDPNETNAALESVRNRTAGV